MREQESKQKSIIRPVMNKIEMIVLVILIFLLGVVLYNKFIVNDGAVKFFGYSQAVVVSGSMIPAIDINDIVIYKDVPLEEYQLDDVVIYLREEKRICHRIIAISGQQMITKGDANSRADTPISTEQLQGKVVQVIPKVGAVSRWILTPRGIAVLVIFILAVYLLPNVVARLKKR